MRFCRTGIPFNGIDESLKTGNDAGLGSMLVNFQFSQRLAPHDVFQHFKHERVRATAKVGQRQTIKLRVGGSYRRASDEFTLV